MLRRIDPLLSPDLLHILASMGHGDDIVVADANFPSASMGRRVVRLDGIDAAPAVRAILSLMPLDTFVEDPALSMQVVGEPDTIPEAVAGFQRVLHETADNPVPIRAVERFTFYERARQAFAIVQTGETRLYGNLILKKGVVATATRR